MMVFKCWLCRRWWIFDGESAGWWGYTPQQQDLTHENSPTVPIHSFPQLCTVFSCSEINVWFEWLQSTVNPNLVLKVKKIAAVCRFMIFCYVIHAIKLRFNNETLVSLVSGMEHNPPPHVSLQYKEAYRWVRVYLYTICIKILDHLHITPTGAAKPWKLMPWSLWSTVFVLILMPEEVWKSTDNWWTLCTAHLSDL